MKHWSCELNFEGRQKRSTLKTQVIGWDSLEVFALRQRDRDLYHAGLPKNWTAYEALKALAVKSPILSSYMTEFHKDDLEAEKRFIGRIAKWSS